MDALLLDPWLLSFGPGQSPELYVSDLLAIFEASQERCVDLQVSACAAELLEQDQAYPLSGRMPEPLWPMRADVFKLVTSILDKTAKIEDQQIAAVLCDRVTTRPDLLDGLTEGHVNHLHELMVISAIRGELGGIVSGLHSKAAPCGELHLSAEVADVECRGQAVRLGTYCSIVYMCLAISDFYSSIEPELLALRGYVRKAICLASWQYLRNYQTCPFLETGWSVGENFLVSVAQCGLYNNRARMAAMIRAAIAVLCGNKLHATHALRVGRGPEDSQVIRDSDHARAWRMDIDDELHLHYWKSAQHIEFADVVFHNDFHITP
jgi:hypothetical protein